MPRACEREVSAKDFVCKYGDHQQGTFIMVVIKWCPRWSFSTKALRSLRGIDLKEKGFVYKREAHLRHTCCAASVSESGAGGQGVELYDGGFGGAFVNPK